MRRSGRARRRDPLREGTRRDAREAQAAGSLGKGIALPSLDPTRAPISPDRLQTSPRSPTCWTRGSAARTPSRPPTLSGIEKPALTSQESLRRPPGRTASGSRALAPPVRLSARARLADLPGPPRRARSCALPTGSRLLPP